MKKSQVTWAILAIAAGLAFAPAAWAANDRAAKPTTHTRQSEVRKPAAPKNSCDYDRAAGRCVIDLGYGRCIECNNGPL
jgi:hypothetical protein